MAHDQPATELFQLGIELDQRLADEFHPAIGARQGVEDGAIEHEHADHLAAGPQRLPEGGVVVDAEIAAEPHESLGVGLVDGK